MDAPELLYSYMEAHNTGVRTGNFDFLVGLFHPDAEFRFEGLDFGPFLGREAIAHAFRHYPPDDELYLGATHLEHGRASALYCWRNRPWQWAGSIHVEPAGETIGRLVIRNR